MTPYSARSPPSCNTSTSTASAPRCVSKAPAPCAGPALPGQQSLSTRVSVSRGRVLTAVQQCISRSLKTQLFQQHQPRKMHFPQATSLEGIPSTHSTPLPPSPAELAPGRRPSAPSIHRAHSPEIPPAAWMPKATPSPNDRLMLRYSPNFPPPRFTWATDPKPRS